MPKENTECPGCLTQLRTPQVLNALSRYGHGYICNDCGRTEAFMGDFIGRPFEEEEPTQNHA